MSNAEVISFSFCQVSDLNLDSSAALNLHLSPAQRKERNEESIEALADAMKLASSDDVSAVLVPGNLFDSENITTYAMARVQRIFAMLQEIPVFITPGALDPLFNDSLYNESALRAHGLEPWSENVHIFRSDVLQTFTLPGRSSVKLSGIGMARVGRSSTPLIPALAEADKAAINILLLPLGHQETRRGLLDSELALRIKSLGYSYTAVSGFKNEVAFKNEDGSVFAAAAGTFIGQTERELGPRKALYGNLDRQIGGGLEITVRSSEFDPRRIVSCSFDVTAKEPTRLRDLLQQEISASGARPGRDIMVLRLDGFYADPEVSDLVSAARNQDFFHIKIIDNMRPDFLDTLQENNVIEARFVSLMHELRAKANAESSVSSTRATLINDALYYGLEAIREGRVTIRHAD